MGRRGVFEREPSLTGVMSTLLGLQNVLSRMHRGIALWLEEGQKGREGVEERA